MSTLLALEARKHDLRVEMVKLHGDRNPAQMVKVYQKLLEVKRAESYLRRV